MIFWHSKTLGKLWWHYCFTNFQIYSKKFDNLLKKTFYRRSYPYWGEHASTKYGTDIRDGHGQWKLMEQIFTKYYFEISLKFHGSKWIWCISRLISFTDTHIIYHTITLIFINWNEIYFQSYIMDCYFRQSWVDKRLSFVGYKVFSIFHILKILILIILISICFDKWNTLLQIWGLDTCGKEVAMSWDLREEREKKNDKSHHPQFPPPWNWWNLPEKPQRQGVLGGLCQTLDKTLAHFLVSHNLASVDEELHLCGIN